MPYGSRSSFADVAPLAAAGRVRAVHPVAVLLARADTRQVAVPDEAIHLGELNPRLAAIPAVEQAQLHPLGHLGEQGELVSDPSQVAPRG